MPATRQEYLLELQIAVDARLMGDSTLMGMITGTFDIAPEKQTPPYITYGQHVGGTLPTFGHVNSESLFLLDIFSGAGSDDECYQILAEVRRLIETRPGNTPLVLPDYGVSYLKCEWSTILHETDYNIRHMPVRFRTKATEL
jgi:hypothetical protein